MELWVGALNLGFLYAFMTMGVFITFRIHDFPDITVDGSFTTGAAVTAILLIHGLNPFLALAAAFVIGTFAGSITALIHTRLKINGLLAGILVMTGLYSINLHIMGRSNIPLLKQTTLFSHLGSLNPGLPTEIWTLFGLLVLMVIFWLIVSFFFRTDLGISMRITGSNPTMAAATGVNVDRMTVFGVALANGMVGISGGLVAQYQGFADIGMGIGTIVIGLAAVIIGESLFRVRSMYVAGLSVIVGSIIFRLMIAVALYVGMNPIDLKLLTAVFVLFTLIASKRMSGGKQQRGSFLLLLQGVVSDRRTWLGFAAVLTILVALAGYSHYRSRLTTSSKVHKIGFLQVSDHGLLNITRDSFVEEMERLGYKQGKNCQLMLENANGDLATVNTILDKFLHEDVDLVVPISTACTQATINKIKDRPVVFATVANPFIIGAGRSEENHLANVTGVYGWVPMEKSMEMVRTILPGELTVGSIWDPAHANSVFNVDNLKKVIGSYDDVDFVGATITSSSEVYQAALSLVNRDIDVFVLSPDNIVYSAFESVVKAARTREIPIFVSDVERLSDGALGTLGYDYSISGIQAAHLVDRVLNGENPKGIPFERYNKMVVGLNMEVAKQLGLTLPTELLSKATTIHGIAEPKVESKFKIGIIQFATEPNVELCKKGVLQGLAHHGYVDQKNIEIIYKNAQADFSMINAIIQDFVRRKVDVILPLSTPCLQSALQLTHNRDDIKVVFTYVSDPYLVGAAESPTDHPANLTGISCFPPIEKLLDLIKEFFPDTEKVGVVWNSSEVNSEAVLLKARPHAPRIGLEIMEAPVTTPGEVLDASRALVQRGAQALLNPGDNTLNVSFDSFTKVADENSIPVFSVDTERTENTFVMLGPDCYQTGYQGGDYVGRVLNGEPPASIPIHQTEETLFIINMDVAAKHGYRAKQEILARADRVIGHNRQASTNTENAAKRLALFLFSDHTVLMETARGVVEELERSSTLETNQISIDTKNGQNEFYLTQSIAQDIVRQKYDYIITLSTPALQVMAQANQEIPHIFGAVTDPYRMGVAKTPQDHLPNLTGVATLQPVEATIRTMREIFPRAKRIGMVWNPGEACSEACTLKARKVCATYQFELVEANVSSSGEVMDALKSLLNKEIDLFLTSGDNTVIMALDPIAATLRRYKVPYFTNSPSDVDRGAFVSIGADYYEVGKETARMAIRVINGENPQNIPIKNFAPDKMYVNLKLAREYGVHLEQGFLQRAERVVR
jgi:putative ABC transport system permease protein